MQADLTSYFTLKCFRVPVRSKKIADDGYFHEVEVRFGNRSKAEETQDDLLNPIIIGKTEKGFEGKIFEFCLDRPLVGRYLILNEKKDYDDKILVGEIQIIVE